MNKNHLFTLTFGIMFLFLIQSMGSLVEAIYILDLLKTSLDEKALGLMFFFAPILLWVFPKKISKTWIWLLFAVLFLSRGSLPYLPTLGRMIASGLATAAVLLLFPFLITAKIVSEVNINKGKTATLGLAFAILLSIFLRTSNFSFDYSLQSEGGWVGWGLGFLLGILILPLQWQGGKTNRIGEKPKRQTFTILGIFLVICLIWFAFSTPAVIAHWSGADYKLVIIAVSLLSSLWVLLELYRPNWLEGIPSIGIILWNVFFALSLTSCLLARRVPFPLAPDSPPVIVGSANGLQQGLFLLTIILFPVIYLDFHLLVERLQKDDLTPSDFAGGMLLGSFVLVCLVFMQIFSNVWGYVEPISPWFRNKYWLPYLIMSGLLALLVGKGQLLRSAEEKLLPSKSRIGWMGLFAFLLLGNSLAAFLTTRLHQFEPSPTSLVVMTYNIQQANDVYGERSYKRQLAIIQKIAPDILALQESDSAHISLNNVDIVRYFAGKLGYYSYYGPSPVSGTYGTAILAKFPLHNPRVVFSYSDKDEIGTTVAEIWEDGKVFTIYDVHPDGTDMAMQAFAQTLIKLVNGKEYVIALGDYNLRDDEQPYKLIATQLTNVWESVYPSKISPEGVDMSGRNRIDHIFISAPLKALQAFYILPPESATDHPLHWAVIGWER